MFFEDEKDNTGNTPEIQTSGEETISWEGILGDDEDLVSTDSVSASADVLQNPDKDILIEDAADDVFASNDSNDSLELNQILSDSPKQKAFDAFGGGSGTDDEIDIDIDKQLAELDERSKIEDKEIKITGPKIKPQQSSVSSALVIALVVAVILAFGVHFLLGVSKSKNLVNDAVIPKNDIAAVQQQMDNMENGDIEQRQQQESIPVVSEDEAGTIKPTESEKKEVVKVQPTGRANPFLPLQKYMAVDVPGDGTGIDGARYSASGIPAPPREYGEKNEPAIKMMTISVSGIMYDENGPSAIITYDGSDYFVQKGDKLDEYKVIDIQRSFVKIALGKNIYKASVGEEFKISTDIQGSAQYLPQKQGGGRQYYSPGSYTSENDVRVNVR